MKGWRGRILRRLRLVLDSDMINGIVSQEQPVGVVKNKQVSNRVAWQAGARREEKK